MGIWLIAAIVLQLACAACAAKLARPAVWLQIILLVPGLGALAFCGYEIARAVTRASNNRAPARDRGESRPENALGGIGYRAVCARTVESRRALAEECLLIGRHADARLLFESCRTANDQDTAAFPPAYERPEMPVARIVRGR